MHGLAETISLYGKWLLLMVRGVSFQEMQSDDIAHTKLMHAHRVFGASALNTTSAALLGLGRTICGLLICTHVIEQETKLLFLNETGNETLNPTMLLGSSVRGTCVRPLSNSHPSN
jgi:hypothetical protein